MTSSVPKTTGLLPTATWPVSAGTWAHPLTAVPSSASAMGLQSYSPMGLPVVTSSSLFPSLPWATPSSNALLNTAAMKVSSNDFLKAVFQNSFTSSPTKRTLHLSPTTIPHHPLLIQWFFISTNSLLFLYILILIIYQHHNYIIYCYFTDK